MRSASFWRAYLPFVAVSLAFVGYFVWNAGAAQLTGSRAAGYYGYASLAAPAATEVRAVLHLALPFSGPLGFKTMGPSAALAALVEVGLLLLLARRFRCWAALLLSGCWVLVALLPTSVFASVFNADRYLFVALVGVALLVGLLADAIHRHARRWPRRLVWLALAIYAVAGIAHLAQRRTMWHLKGEEAEAVIGEALHLGPLLPPGAELTFVDVTSGLANGLDGALRARGFPGSIGIVWNVECGRCPGQADLAAAVLACGAAPGRADREVVALGRGASLLRADPACAGPVIARDRRDRPYAWQAVPAR